MLENLLPNLNIIDLITALSGLAVFVSVFAVWNTLVPKDSMKGRVKELQTRREELRSGFSAPRKRVKPVKKIDHVNFMRGIVDKLKLLQSEQVKKITLKLNQAGFRSKDAIVIYLFAKLISPALGLLLSLFFIFGMGSFGGDFPKQSLLALGCILGGYYVPELFIKNVADKRKEAIIKGLPDALDLLVICAEAGLTLDAALNRVSNELGKASPELAEEFSLTAIELGFLGERKQALDNLNDRCDIKSIKSVVATLAQTEKYGTPLAQSLRVLSGEFRNERMMKAEEKAARLPAVMTVPLILFILPVLFIVLLGPAACSVADNVVNRGF